MVFCLGTTFANSVSRCHHCPQCFALWLGASLCTICPLEEKSLRDAVSWCHLPITGAKAPSDQVNDVVWVPFASGSSPSLTLDGTLLNSPYPAGPGASIPLPLFFCFPVLLVALLPISSIPPLLFPDEVSPNHVYIKGREVHLCSQRFHCSFPSQGPVSSRLLLQHAICKFLFKKTQTNVF